jgi:hypothetical protein
MNRYMKGTLELKYEDQHAPNAVVWASLINYRIMKQVVFRYALMATGLLCILGLLNWFLVARPMGYHASEIMGYLSMIASLSLIYFAIRHYRQQYRNGFLSFGQGFRIGIWITLITSALFLVYSVIYFALFGEEFKAWADGHFKQELTAEAYQEYLAQIEQMGSLYDSALFQGMVMFMTVFLIGLIITLISATMLKKGTWK